jgi:hypothetical protein
MAEKDNDGGKNAALVIAGGAFGIGLAALLSSKPAAAAPDSAKLDYIASLLEHMGATQEAILTAIKNINLGGLVFPDPLLTPWIAKEPQHIFEQAIRSVGVFFSDIMVDCRRGKRMMVKVESSLDVAVAIQLIGNMSESFNLATDINGPFPCPINGNISIGLAWDDWHPYVGVRITAAAPPTIGLLNIWSVIQD